MISLLSCCWFAVTFGFDVTSVALVAGAGDCVFGVCGVASTGAAGWPQAAVERTVVEKSARVSARVVRRFIASPLSMRRHCDRAALACQRRALTCSDYFLTVAGMTQALPGRNREPARAPIPVSG